MVSRIYLILGPSFGQRAISTNNHTPSYQATSATSYSFLSLGWIKTCK